MINENLFKERNTHLDDATYCKGCEKDVDGELFDVKGKMLCEECLGQVRVTIVK